MVDYDSEVAQASAKTWNLPRATLSEAYQSICEGHIRKHVVVGDLHDKRLWTLLTVLQIQCFCVSGPCQLWSTAGRTAGLSLKDGKMLPTVLYMSNCIGATSMVTENVAGFPAHSRYEALVNFATPQCYCIVEFVQSILLPQARTKELHRLLQAMTQNGDGPIMSSLKIWAGKRTPWGGHQVWFFPSPSKLRGRQRATVSPSHMYLWDCTRLMH